MASRVVRLLRMSSVAVLLAGCQRSLVLASYSETVYGVVARKDGGYSDLTFPEPASAALQNQTRTARRAPASARCTPPVLNSHHPKGADPMKTSVYLTLSGLVLAPGCGDDPAGELVSPELEVLSTGVSVSGHGNWINPQGEYVSRTFHGVVKDGGIVVGNFVQHITALNGEKRVNKSTVDCIRLLSPKEAVVSGTVEENINPAVIGQTQIFRVRDNGEGNDDPDEISALVFRQPATGINCSNLDPLPVRSAIEAGNIQVKS